ncbi:5202_t:CDS:1, partial [Paraglomus occultum]
GSKKNKLREGPLSFLAETARIVRSHYRTGGLNKEEDEEEIREPQPGRYSAREELYHRSFYILGQTDSG